MSDETSRIVAWLRERADSVERLASHKDTLNPDYWRGQAFAYEKAASQIEQSAHLKDTTHAG